MVELSKILKLKEHCVKNFLDDKNAAYDALAKKILSQKAILAQILKFSVKEYSECKLEE